VLLPPMGNLYTDLLLSRGRVRKWASKEGFTKNTLNLGSFIEEFTCLKYWSLPVADLYVRLFRKLVSIYMPGNCLVSLLSSRSYPIVPFLYRSLLVSAIILVKGTFKLKVLRSFPTKEGKEI